MSMHRETPRWRRYLRFWGEDAAADVEDELAFHIETRAADLTALGLSAEAAAERAAREFGDVDSVRGELHAIARRRRRRGMRWRVLMDLASDVRLGLRALRRNAAYAGSTLITLALVVGAAGTVVSLVNGVLLRPLPYPQPDALVVGWERNVPRERGENVVSVPAYEAWRDQASNLTALAALVPDRQTLTENGPERVRGAAVTASWFDVVGVRPAIGRGFTEAEARAGDVVVLSHGLWQTHFGGAPIIGQRVRLGDASYTAVGVMPSSFAPPAFGWLGPEQRYWVPFAPDEDNRQWGRFLLVLGRLAPGSSSADLDAELKRIARARARTDASLQEWTADAVPLHEQVTGDVQAPLLVLLVAVSCLLLIGLVNVTNLTLMRAHRRESEFGVRAAIGAGRGRIARQLAAEALAIALIAAPLGLVFTAAGVEGLRALLPDDVPRAANVRLDGTTIVVCAGASLLAMLALGLAPMLRLSLARAHERLRSGGTRIIAGTAARSLVVAEVALALVLAVGAGLAARSFIALRSVPLGFEAANVVGFRVSLPLASYEGDDARRAFFETLLQRIAGMPGIEEVGAANIRPLGGAGPATSVTAVGIAGQGTPPVADLRVATPGYFSTLRIELLRGRGLASIGPGDAGAAVVSMSLAHALWTGADPVGKRFVLALNPPDTVTVAGVVADVRLNGPAADPRPTVYLPYAVEPVEAMDVMVRSTLSPPAAVSLLRRAVAELDASLPVYEVETLTRSVAEVSARERVDAALLTAFSLLAALLAATGIYGVLALDVAGRRREMAVRLALGAPPARLRADVVRSSLTLALIGLGVGLAGALGLTRFMASILFGVQPTDAATYATVILLLLAIALLAAWLPAQRAASTDPMHSMRAE